MKHLSYLCPGLHDADSKQLIKPISFSDFFLSEREVEIPFFQRRYW
jgi:hypothetical protein